ncbi:sulfotransferase family 2 domain-containing protein [Maricaulis sp.]|uniref:sulfotransferase family 2 domain-containing protein n=1 Tax=Maricaulis sp. TaxID=1486257 RepID=UPI00344E46D2
MPQENLYVFNHVPKTAGTAFKKFLSSNVASGRFLDIIHPNKEEVGRVIEACDLSDYDWICANFHNEQIARVRELSGRRLKIVTILRDPVERGLSLYRFIKNKKTHALYEMVSRLSLTEFVSSTDLTRQLSEYYPLGSGEGVLRPRSNFWSTTSSWSALRRKWTER